MEIKVKSSCPEKNLLLKRILDQVDGNIVLSPGADSMEIPCRLIREDVGALLVSIYVYTRVSGARRLILGVDPGASFTGLVAILDGYIVYKGVFYGLEGLADAITVAAGLVDAATVYVGGSARVAEGLVARLRRGGVDVRVVPEDVPGRSLEYIGWGKERKHVRDALKIALTGMYLSLRGDGRGAR